MTGANRAITLVNSPLPAHPRVSVVIPCRNEENYIGQCVESLISGTFPTNCLEVLVVDGMSTDGTRKIVRRLATHNKMIRLVDNPAGWTPVAMNRGVAASRGDFILICGAHNRYEPDFVAQAVQYLVARPEADAVGGVINTTSRTQDHIGRAIALSVSHPFGVGGSRFRTIPSEPQWADTAFGCCYRRSVFDRIGLFNEKLARGQDMEFNLRLRDSGGRLLLVPGLVSEYFARSTLRSFWKHNFANGEWAILPFLYSPIRPVGIRHLVPLIFVASTLGGVIAFPWLLSARVLLALALGLYVIGLSGACLHVAWTTGSLRDAVPCALTFPLLHFGYGLGSLRGLLRLGWRILLGDRRPDPNDAWPRMQDYRPRVAVT